MPKSKKKHELAEIIPMLSDDALKVATGMIDDALFMEQQLKTLRKTIETEGVSENYQYGSKQTAAMTSYLQIQKQYGVIIRYLTDLLPKNQLSPSDDLMDFIKD